CYGYAENVVTQSEEKVLFDVAHYTPAKQSGSGDTVEVPLDKRYPGTFDRYIGPCSHGNADVSLCQRWRVIDAVTSHGDLMPFLLQALYLVKLIVRKHLRLIAIKIEGFTYCPRGIRIITREHDHFHPGFMKFLHGRLNRRLDLIGDHYSPKNLVPFCQVRNSLAEALFLLNALLKVLGY